MNEGARYAARRDGVRARLHATRGYALLLVAAGFVMAVGVFAARDIGISSIFWFIASRPRLAMLNTIVVASALILAGLIVGRRVGISARLRLAMSYAVFLVAAGFVTLFGMYIILRYVPDYPPGYPGNPGDADGTIASRQVILNAVVGASGTILAVLAIIGVSGGWILAGWVLRPLERINEAARIAAAGDLEHRIELTGRNDEFRELADTFDFMLGRLHDAFTTQERFAANASHELRTPLTVTETLLDVARRNPDGQDYPTLIDRLSITNARAIGLTEALLRLADVNAITASSVPIDLAALARDAVAANLAEANHLGVTLDIHPETATTIGDAALLSQLASNLVQNAVRHNHASGTVRIATGHDRPSSIVSLRIENTGDMYTPELAAQLSEPFLRGRGRVNHRDRAKQGYGLGLALVARITEVHHGVLTIVPRDGGGLVVTVKLPNASQRRTQLALGSSAVSDSR